MNNPKIAFLVHGGADSIAAVRARGLSRNYPPEKLLFLMRESNRFGTARDWTRQMRAFSPDLLYVLNLAMPGALMALWWRLVCRKPFLLDTGDVNFAMAASAGTVPVWKLPVLRWLEILNQHWAQAIIVRGTRHREYLREHQGYPRVALIRDGFAPAPIIDEPSLQRLRQQLGLDNRFVVGVMGSLVFSPRLKMCYGWDLIPALARLPGLPMAGLIIGAGSGRNWLEDQARQYGVRDRIVFCGRVPYEAVPLYLRLMDVALSTQTNNLAGQVRTTGKLPEYMAAERFILASRVGEAELFLPEDMLIDYQGELDADYPRKLAERLQTLYRNPALLEARHALKTVAEKNCSYEVLSRQFDNLIASFVLS